MLIFGKKNWDLSFFPHISGWVHDFSIINRLCFVCCWISCRNQSGAKYYVTTAITTFTPLSSLFVTRSLSFLPFFTPCTIFLSKLKHTSLKKNNNKTKNIYIFRLIIKKSYACKSEAMFRLQENVINSFLVSIWQQDEKLLYSFTWFGNIDNIIKSNVPFV